MSDIKPIIFLVPVIVLILISALYFYLLKKTGNWAYTDSMPIIPIVNVGISPILQFMILPLLIYLLSFYCLKNYEQKKITYDGDYEIK